MMKLKMSYLKNIVNDYKLEDLSSDDLKFLSEEIKLPMKKVMELYKRI